MMKSAQQLLDESTVPIRVEFWCRPSERLAKNVAAANSDDETDAATTKKQPQSEPQQQTELVVEADMVEAPAPAAPAVSAADEQTDAKACCDNHRDNEPEHETRGTKRPLEEDTTTATAATETAQEGQLDASSTTAQTAATLETKPAPQKESKRQRRERKAEEVANRVCNFARVGDSCPRGSSCHFVHDIDMLLSTKQPDIGPLCPIFDLRGSCSHGFVCRFVESHLERIEGQPRLVKNEDKFKQSELDKATWQEINYLPHETQDKLRRRSYLFTRTNKANKSNKDEQDLKAEADTTTKTTTTATTTSDNTIGAVESGPRVGEDEDHSAATSKFGSKRTIFHGKSILAPLTTTGNLPFRRVCKDFGVDITVSEMAMAQNLLQAQHSEWALLRRHPSEKIFGVQICGAQSDILGRCCEVIENTCSVDFIDINVGCPIDLVTSKGAGSALLTRQQRLIQIASVCSKVLTLPLTIKMRMGWSDNEPVAHSLVPLLASVGVAAVTIHGRSRAQRYSRLADWNYVASCTEHSPIPVIGNGDVFSFEEFHSHLESNHSNSIMIGRGALIKPWIFREINERRHWDISATERLEMIHTYCNYGLEHWGSDQKGVDTTRRFLLEALSFLYRYVPVGLMEVLPQRMNHRPPHFFGRSDSETLLASADPRDWVKISEMFLGKVPPGFSFKPKHAASGFKSTVVEG